MEPLAPPSNEAEQRRRFILLLTVRASVVSALLGSTIFFNIRSGLPGLSPTQLILYSLAGAVFFMTVGYAVWLRGGPRSLGLHVQIQVVFDVLVSGLLVYITGGLESPFTFFFALPIIQTALFFPRRGALMSAGLCCLLLGGLYVLESQGLLPVDLEGRVRIPTEISKVVYLLAFNFALFLTIGWLAGSLGEQLRRTGQELIHSEKEVEALVALNRDIVLSLRSGLLALDDKQRVSLVNPVAEKILGCKVEEVLGTPISGAFPSLASLVAHPNGKNDLANDGAWESDPLARLEAVHLRADGSEVPIGLTLSPLTRANGSVGGTLVHMQDLTRLKAMEEVMKRGERLAALGGMAAVMAHEIRNPLASISGSVQMLGQAGSCSDAEQRLLDIILRETGRLDGLLTDFLAYARPKDPSLTRVDLLALVHDAVEVFVQRKDEGQPKVELSLEPVTLEADADQLRQVLWNLLTNAEQATLGAGTIRVGLRRTRQKEQDWVELDVADDGPGVSEMERDRVFEPFFTTKEKGTGLGLATVAQIVDAHKGTLELTCPAEGGSRFCVRLPLGPAARGVLT